MTGKAGVHLETGGQHNARLSRLNCVNGDRQLAHVAKRGDKPSLRLQERYVGLFRLHDNRQRRLRRDAVARTRAADGRDNLAHHLDGALGIGVHKRGKIVGLGPRRTDEQLAMGLHGKLLVDLLGNEGHDGMQQAQRHIKHVHQVALARQAVSRIGAGAQTAL